MKQRNYLRLVIHFLLLVMLCAVSMEVQAQRKKDLEKARKIATQGDKLFNQKDYRGAINKYAEAIVIVPNFPAAHFWKGFAHYYLKEYDQALIDFNKALSQGFQPQAEIYKVRWQLNFQQKNYDAALSDALQASQQDPLNPIYNLVIGDIYRQKGAYREALDYYKRAAERDANNADVHYFIALSHNQLGEHAAQGLAALEAIKKGTKYLGESNYFVADAFFKARRFDEAIEYYEKTIASKPDIYEVYSILADIYRNKNRFEEAIAVTRKGLQLFPNDAGLYTNLSWFYSLADQHESAIAAAQSAIRLAPEQYMAYTNLCRAYNDTKQYDLAIKTCNNALQLNPNDGETYFYLGRAYDLSGRTNEAPKFYQKAVEGLLTFTANNPDYSDGFYLLGNAYYAAGQREKAIDAYKRTLALSPRFARARYNLGYLYYLKKDMRSAREQYTALLQIDPNLAEKLRQAIER